MTTVHFCRMIAENTSIGDVFSAFVVRVYVKCLLLSVTLLS